MESLFNYKFVDTCTGVHPGRILQENVCSVAYQKGFKAVRFPLELSRKIINAECKTMRLAYNELTDSYAFVFTQDDAGHKVALSKSKVQQPRVTVSSVKIVSILARHFGKKPGDLFRLKLSEDMSKRDDVIFLHIDGLYEY